jgi:hypothetical protein
MDFREWIGRTETVSDLVTPTPYAALSATFDRAAERPAPGTPLPLWKRSGVPSRRCFLPVPGRTATPAWTPFPHSASIPT